MEVEPDDREEAPPAALPAAAAAGPIVVKPENAGKSLTKAQAGWLEAALRQRVRFSDLSVGGVLKSLAELGNDRPFNSDVRSFFEVHLPGETIPRERAKRFERLVEFVSSQ